MKTTKIALDMAVEAVDENNLNAKYDIKTTQLPCNITKKRLEVRTEAEAKELSKAKGLYFTLDSGTKITDKRVRRELSRAIGRCLIDLTSAAVRARPNVLVVGLGNRFVSVDSLGPLTADGIRVTRSANETDCTRGGKLADVRAVATGVFATTGLESFDIVKGVIDRVKINMAIVVDTLATVKTQRLFSSFQITNAGIKPAGATDGRRLPLTYKTLGVPTIAVGVPLAVYARSLIYDAAAHINKEVSVSEKILAAEAVLGSENLSALFTPKDVNEGVKLCAEVISTGINSAFGV